MRLHPAGLACLGLVSLPLLAQGALAQNAPPPTDRWTGTYVGTNIVGPVTVEVRREGEGYVVVDRSSAAPMQGAATVDAEGVLRGEFVVKLLGFTRRHRFALTPDGDGLRYRTTGQDTPLERYQLLDGSEESRFWFDAIGGRQLAAFDRYSSGGSTSGGYSSEKRATLCSDGSFSYRAQSSTSISGDGISASSSSSDGGEGRWRLRTRGGVTTLEVRFTDGRIEQLTLSRRGDELFVDGERWLRGDRVC